jgi:hypothetical protein
MRISRCFASSNGVREGDRRKMTTEVARLRQRANWYREFAKLGTLQEREWRSEMADYFDQLADQAEKAAERSPANNH